MGKRSVVLGYLRLKESTPLHTGERLQAECIGQLLAKRALTTAQSSTTQASTTAAEIHGNRCLVTFIIRAFRLRHEELAMFLCGHNQLLVPMGHGSKTQRRPNLVSYTQWHTFLERVGVLLST